MTRDPESRSPLFISLPDSNEDVDDLADREWLDKAVTNLRELIEQVKQDNDKAEAAWEARMDR